MVFYCENCNIQSPTNRCPRCGKRKLREIRDTDFCFYDEMSDTMAESLKEILDEEGIGCARIPHGSGWRTKIGLRLEGYLVYVEYKGIPFVQDFFRKRRQRITEMLKKELEQKIDKLHVWEYDEANIRSMLKLKPSFNLIELFQNILNTAVAITDHGDINDETFVEDDSNDFCDFPHYYCVANEKYEMWLNSYSMRVHKIKIRK